tara:strand:+ start:314 stop:922 length:609 start_codon:yes stop_codon:yes gene_type:complete
MIRVVDNFFPDPYSIRSTALKAQNPTKHLRYPGERFEIPPNLGDYTLSLIREYDPHVSISERDPHGMSFNFINASYVGGVCHADGGFSRYNCIVYLTPNPPPESGLEIYDDFYSYESEYPSHIRNCNRVKEKFLYSSRNFIDRFLFKRHGIKNSLKHQKNKIAISNKFNRMVLLPSSMIHRPQNYFGKNRRDCRLTLTTFLD